LLDIEYLLDAVSLRFVLEETEIVVQRASCHTPAGLEFAGLKRTAMHVLIAVVEDFAAPMVFPFDFLWP